MSETIRQCAVCGEPNGRHLLNCVHQKFPELSRKPRLTAVSRNVCIQSAPVTEAMIEAAAAATGCPSTGKVGPSNREFFTQIYTAMHAASVAETPNTAPASPGIEGNENG